MHEKNCKIKECMDMQACSYVNWHKNFHKITIRSVCVPLPKYIIKYLLEEIIILPKECFTDEENITFSTSTSNDQHIKEEEVGQEEEDEDEEKNEQPEFPAFSKLLKDTIAGLGGSVFVKTNWHCPKDAFWITAGQTLCCKDITDIYQLLKASGVCKEDLLGHNIENSASEIINYSDSETHDDTEFEKNQFLIFKKWHDIHPGNEFRCFVRNKKLIAISPRDWPQFHEYICTQRENIVNDIVSMFKEHIQPKFPLYDYIFDVVRNAKDEVYLLDFSPFSPKFSESLAFEWSELQDNTSDDDDDPEFRYLSSDCGIQPNKRNNYGIPRDILDMFQASQPSVSNVNHDESGRQNTLDDVINNRLENIFRNQNSDE